MTFFPSRTRSAPALSGRWDVLAGPAPALPQPPRTVWAGSEMALGFFRLFVGFLLLLFFLKLSEPFPWLKHERLKNRREVVLACRVRA